MYGNSHHRTLKFLEVYPFFQDRQFTISRLGFRNVESRENGGIRYHSDNLLLIMIVGFEEKIFHFIKRRKLETKFLEEKKKAFRNFVFFIHSHHTLTSFFKEFRDKLLIF